MGSHCPPHDPSGTWRTVVRLLYFNLSVIKMITIILDKIFPQVQAAQPIEYCPPDHPFQPGDTVLIRHLKTDQLEPRWK